MAAAHVDVGAGSLAGKHQLEVIVLKVLRVGELHQFRLLFSRPRSV